MTDAPIQFEAIIPDGNSFLRFDRDSSRVTLEISGAYAAEVYKLQAARMAGCSLKISVEIAETRVIGKIEPKKTPKGEHGKLWQSLHQSGIVHVPGVREVIEDYRQEGETDSWQILHRVFDVVSLSEVSPEMVYAKFPPNEYPGVRLMVENAKRKAAA